MKPLSIAVVGFFLLCSEIGCKTASKIAAVPAFSLENLMKNAGGTFDSVLARKNDLKIQMIYTQIDRDENNLAHFTDYFFNTDSNRYFYPASTVKFPIALLALEKLNDLKIEGLNKRSMMITDSGYKNETVVYNDPTSPTGAPTIEQYIKKIFLVSDNDAFNRLYEFVGRKEINDRLHKLGYGETQILHRLAIFLSQDENRQTNPIRFFDEKGSLVYSKPLLFDEEKYASRKDSIGKGFHSNDQLVMQPMDFSLKNRISLFSLHNILKSVIFPESVPMKQQFRLTEDDYKFVRKYMSEFPAESIFPQYDSSYQDAYSKFLFYGEGKGVLPKNIRIFHKSGDAYGFLTDVAYIADFDNKVEFMLSATIYCNSDGILNDDKYDYDSVGLPFMKQLGKLIYDLELKRKKIRLPDLSSFQFIYD